MTQQGRIGFVAGGQCAMQPARVEEAVASQLKLLPRETTATKSWADFGAVIIVKSLADAVPLVDRLAPRRLAFCWPWRGTAPCRLQRASWV